MRDYLTLTEAVAIHEQLISLFGGAAGIREQGALESALMRPQLGYYQDIIQEAAALMESLANNHPFVDGNKRVAVFIADTFLRMNGYCIDCDNQAAYDYIIHLFGTRKFQFDEIDKWLRTTVRTLAV